MYTVLLTDIANGNEKAFAQFYDAFYPELKRTCRKYRVPEEQVADIRQEVCMNLWNKRDQLLERPNMTGYMLSMVRNKVMDLCKKQKRTSQLIQSHTTIVCDCAAENDFTNPIWYGRIELLMEDTMSHLSPKQKEAMACKWAGLTRKDAADKLNTSIAAIDRSQQEANKKMRSAALDFIEKLCLLLPFFIY
jgi:RNA polymerase sigma-70 factor (ECF subfamily)